MRKLVRESISFERGGDPRRSMKVGKIERLKEKYGRDSLDGMLKSASLMGDLVDVKFLVKQGADIHTDNNASLRLAAEHGHLDVVKYLVEQGAKVRAGDNESLMLAAKYGHLDVVKYLVEQGADIHDERDGALIAAVRYGHLDVVKYLVEQGADPSPEDNYILKVAAEEGHLDIVKYLEEQGVNVREPWFLKQIVIHERLNIIRYLIRSGGISKKNKQMMLNTVAYYGNRYRNHIKEIIEDE